MITIIGKEVSFEAILGAESLQGRHTMKECRVRMFIHMGIAIYDTEIVGMTSCQWPQDDHKYLPFRTLLERE